MHHLVNLVLVLTLLWVLPICVDIFADVLSKIAEDDQW